MPRGNTTRVVRVTLDGAADVFGEPSLTVPDLEPVEKELLVELAASPENGAQCPAPRPTNS